MKYHFVVISVIDYPANELSYSKTRSAFSIEERLTQTQETVNSILKHAPGAKITLVEAGKTNYYSAFEKFKSESIFEYIFTGNRFLTSRAISSPYKGLGETIALLSALSALDSAADTIYFKLSGRYELTSAFERIEWKKSRFNFKDSGYGYSTRLYAFPFQNQLYMYLLTLISIPFLLLNRSIERVYKLLTPSLLLHKQDVLGVSGKVAVDGTPISE